MMNVETVTRTIQLVVAPVVMVSACAILLGGLLQRYAHINERLRTMSRERMDLIFTEHADSVSASWGVRRATERLIQLDAQIPLLMARYRLTHHAVLFVYSAVIALVGDMFMIAFGVVFNADWLYGAILVMFLMGIAILLIGVVFTAVEVRISLKTIEYEIERVMKLPESS